MSEKKPPLEGGSDLDLSEIEEVEIAFPASAPKAKKKFIPREEDSVEIDPTVLAEERKAQVEAELRKPAAPLSSPRPAAVEVEAKDDAAEEAPAPRRFRSSEKSGLFGWVRSLVSARAIGVLLSLGVLGYLAKYSGMEKAYVASAPLCKNSAEGFEGSLPYKSLPVSEGLAPFMAGGMVCDQVMKCTSPYRPWVSVRWTRDHLFPKNPWGEAYKSGNAIAFWDTDTQTLRTRSTEPGRNERLTLGLEECVFRIREEKVAMTKYHLISLVAISLGLGPATEGRSPGASPF